VKVADRVALRGRGTDKLGGTERQVDFLTNPYPKLFSEMLMDDGLFFFYQLVLFCSRDSGQPLIVQIKKDSKPSVERQQKEHNNLNPISASHLLFPHKRHINALTYKSEKLNDLCRFRRYGFFFLLWAGMVTFAFAVRMPITGTIKNH
jgi:hypothetical protein